MKVNLNWVALAIVVGAFSYSAYRAISVQHFPNQALAGQRESQSGSVLRVAHWQLEPGFRQGLQWAIDQYNALEHVREAGIEVIQTPVPERIYNQFMNVHLIAGTAPDIAVKGQTRIIQGNHVARFYANLGELIDEPNPYNAGLSAQDLAARGLPDDWLQYAWRDTFFDGMQGGFDSNIEDFNAVPISTPGPLRLFYNATLLDDVKRFIAESMATDPQPGWLEALWLHDDGDEVAGYLPRMAADHPWLAHAGPPETLGQLFLYCTAVQAFAVAENRPLLVPISASDYGPSDLPNLYRPIFMTRFVETTDLEPGTGISPFEAVIGWESGAWGFGSPEMVAFFEFAREIARFFPVGFHGLGREQAQRRFVLGNAAIISSGGWDASGIFAGAGERDRAEDRFEVVITAPPLPTPDERWARFLPMRISEAGTSTGVPMAINRKSPNFDHAIDFLRFITSLEINERMNKITGWLPSIDGARPQPRMEPFMPDPEGLPVSFAPNFNLVRATIRNVWWGQSKLVITGDIDYATFRERMEATMADPRQGVFGTWVTEGMRTRDQSRSLDRTLSVDVFLRLHGDQPRREARRPSLVYRSLLSDEGIQPRVWWRMLNGDEPYPSFQP